MSGGRGEATARPGRLALTCDLPRTADLVIVGGGVIGTATAFFAARAGLRPVVIEKRPGLASLSTSAATGAFRLQFDNPDEIALVREGIELYTRFAEATSLPGWDLGLCQQGYLWIATTEDTARRQRDIVARQRAWGLDDVELLSGDEARRRFPYLGPEALQARFRAGDGWLDPRRLAVGYARSSGAPCVVETEVTGFDIAGGRVRAVRTSRGSIATDRAVIATGTFSDALAAMAGFTIGIACVRRQRLILPDVPEVPPEAPMTIDEENGAHWRPAIGGGANLMFTQAGVPPGPPLEDVPPTDDFAFGLLEPTSAHAVARIVPFWRDVWARHTSGWVIRAGQYDYTFDHRPMIGRSPVEGLWVNTGYSGHGVMASAGGSRLLVDLLIGRAHEEGNAFRLDRPRLERPLDVI